jgi:hypothetical protein
MLNVTERICAIAIRSAWLLSACLAHAGTTIIVTDPRGNAVPSDVYRALPVPEQRLGRTNALGRLSLKDTCTPDILFTAHPPDNYYKQGTYCSADGKEVRIEVTPIEVIAQLESNIKAATDAGNQPAVAQIAIEIAYRMKFSDVDKASHYRNLAVVASARTASPHFNSSDFWKTADGVKLITWDSDQGQVNWTAVCAQSDLVTCKGQDTKTPMVVPSTKFKLEWAQKAGTVEGVVLLSPAWLKRYSNKDSSTLIFENLKPEDFRKWRYAEASEKP